MRILVVAVLLGAAISAQSSLVRISGRVKDRQGAGISEMCVSAKPFGSASVLAGVRTNDRGEFTFPGLPRGSYELIFLRPDDDIFSWIRRSVIVNGEQDEVSLPPVTLEVSTYHPTFDEDALDKLRQTTHSFGTMEAHESCSLDLDGGKVFCDGNGGQASIERDGSEWYIVPKGGTTIAAAEGWTERGEPCDYATGVSKKVRIADEMPLCVLTATRRSAMWVSFKHAVCRPGDVWISFTTWRR
jgi:hypothetical protein